MPWAASVPTPEPIASDPMNTGGSPSTIPTVPAPAPSVPSDTPTNGALGPIALRRLTTVEYENTVQDVLKVAPGSTAHFRPDDTSLGYNNIAAALSVTPLLAERYAVTAHSLADSLDLNVFAPCAASMAEPACVDAFIQSFGRGIFRRPITNEELLGYGTIYQDERARSNYAGGIRLVAEAMLQSPHFLYKTELGEGSGVERKLTAYELATQLSYLTVGSVPDTELTAAAEAGKLEAPSEREAQLRRLLNTPRGQRWLTTFVEQWVGISDAGYLAKDTGAFPKYTGTLSQAVVEESSRFIGAVLSDAGASVETLLTANFSFANTELGEHYGLAQPPTDWQRVMLPEGQRLGILTQSAFLVATSKLRDSFPIRRGKILRSRMLCGDVPPPPADLMVKPAVINDDTTTRLSIEAHSQMGTVCAGCHTLMDPLGFGLENYDATGAYRTQEFGKPINASGSINSVSPEIDGPFANGIEFAKRVAPSQVLQRCVARESLRWSIGRETLAAPLTDANVLRDQVLISALAERLAAHQSDLRELLVGLVLRDEYAFRSNP